MKRILFNKQMAWLLVLLAAILVPLFVGEYLTSLLVLVCIWSIMSTSLNLLFGYTGQLSLGHSAFLGAGAYAFGLLAIKLHFGFWPSFIGAAALSGLLGFLIGIPALKLRGPYFALVTLGFAAILGVVILAWVNLTGGANGMAGMPRPNPLPLPWGGELRFDSLLSMYYFVLFFLLLITFAGYRLVHSLLGMTFIAIAQDENLTETLGVDTMKRKLLSFTISAVFGGVAGALYASYNVVISPDLAHFSRGMDVLTYVIVGGAGTVAGPIIGTLMLTAIPEVLQIIPYLKTLINGMVLLLFVVFLPGGLVVGLKTLFSKRKKYRQLMVH